MNIWGPVGSGSWQSYYEEIAEEVTVSLLGHGFPAITAPWEETTVDCTGTIESWMESEARVNQGRKTTAV